MFYQFWKKMRKSKFLLYWISALICAIPLLCTCFAEKNFVDISDDYFTWDINPGNQSAVYLNQSWNDWFWFFFLWDNTIEWEYKLQINNIGGDRTRWIICKKQLKWYYTNNFINFWMFPIDEGTAMRLGNNWVKYITWWLYTDCYEYSNWDTTTFSWVYWYIKRDYRSGWIKNSHEIWAWIELENRQRKFQENSDLLLITSENGKYKALSWYIQDSLGKRSQITTNFFERIYIEIPDEYFTNTKTLSGNRNETMFYGNWINWYWLFFLWTWIQWKYSIADRFWQELTCWWQINGYYLLNFSDFWMFPLDKNTERDYSTGGIKHIDWGLYYNCFNAEGKPYKWVYWHIVREYQNWHNGVNTHEIRAWISKEGKRVPISPIELTFSDNTWNTERSLSWYYFSSLAKNGQVFPRFFWDLWLSDNYRIIWNAGEWHVSGQRRKRTVRMMSSWKRSWTRPIRPLLQKRRRKVQKYTGEMKPESITRNTTSVGLHRKARPPRFLRFQRLRRSIWSQRSIKREPAALCAMRTVWHNSALLRSWHAWFMMQRRKSCLLLTTCVCIMESLCRHGWTTTRTRSKCFIHPHIRRKSIRMSIWIITWSKVFIQENFRTIKLIWNQKPTVLCVCFRNIPTRLRNCLTIKSWIIFTNTRIDLFVEI